MSGSPKGDPLSCDIILLMIILCLIFVGLILGSFVNAYVWRIHEQSQSIGRKKKDDIYSKRLSVLNGRSMCTDCKHELGILDLIPLFSWLMLRGKCRYCHKRISIQYPVVEASSSLLFIFSYFWWPNTFNGLQYGELIVWLLIVTILLALVVYDIRWMLLPNSIMISLFVVSSLFALLNIFNSSQYISSLIAVILSVLIGGGLFYIIFQISDGKWIGGGDVKLGWVLGLIAGTPDRSLLFIFLASIIGSIVALPLLLSGKLSKGSIIPFGPFLIVAIFIVQLFGNEIINWYQHVLFSI